MRHKGCSNPIAVILVGIVFLRSTSSTKNRPYLTFHEPPRVAKTFYCVIYTPHTVHAPPLLPLTSSMTSYCHVTLPRLPQLMSSTLAQSPAYITLMSSTYVITTSVANAITTMSSIDLSRQPPLTLIVDLASFDH